MWSKNRIITYLSVNFICIYILLFSEDRIAATWFVLNSNIMYIIISKYIEHHIKIMSMIVLLNVLGWLYTNYYLLMIALGLQEAGNYTYFLSFISMLSIIFLNIGYSIKIKKKNTIETVSKKEFTINSLNYDRLFVLLLILFLIGILLAAYIVFYKIGLTAYLTQSRAEISSIMSNYSTLAFYEEFLVLVMICGLYFYFQVKKKRFLFLFLTSFIMLVLLSIITVSRASFIVIIIPIVYILEKNKVITERQVIVFLFILLIVFAGWKTVLYNLIAGKDIEFSFEMLNLDSELCTWYNIGENVLNDLFKGNITYFWGKSYRDTVISLIIPINDVVPISRWYLMKYDYTTYLRGGGRGFSGALEAFINFNFVGNIIVFLLYGFLFKYLYNKKEKNDAVEIIYVILMTQSYRMYRAESLAFWKTIYWFYFVPILLLFFVCTRKKKINEK